MHKPILAALLWSASAIAGDMTAFSALIGNATMTLQTSISTATSKLTRDQAACAKIASRPKRDKCYSSALLGYNSAIAAAESAYDGTTLAGAGTYLGVPGTVVDAELARLEAIAFDQAFALQQAKIDACLAANVGSTDPHVCDDLTGY